MKFNELLARLPQNGEIGDITQNFSLFIVDDAYGIPREKVKEFGDMDVISIHEFEIEDIKNHEEIHRIFFNGSPLYRGGCVLEDGTQISQDYKGQRDVAERLKKETFGKIERWEVCKRGFGACTMGLFQVTPEYKGWGAYPSPLGGYNGWDYVELSKPTTSEYQRGISPVKNPDRIIGKSIEEIKEMHDVSIHETKFHRPDIDESGKIISLIH